MYDNIALILAGGSGSRIKSASIPKQFIEINNKPIIAYTLETFQKHEEIDAVAVVCSEDCINLMQKIAEIHAISKSVKIIPGGKTRQQSSYLGLSGIKEFTHDNSVVLIHDAARPLVSSNTISQCISLTREFGGATSATPAVDSMLKSDDGKTVRSALPRENIYNIQTPQSFVYSLIMEAHAKAAANDELYFTDDGTLFMKYTGTALKIAESSSINFKITSDEDIRLFKAIVNTAL